MDIQNDKDFAALPEVAKLYQACKERDLTIAEREYLKGARDAWQAKAQVPEGFVLVGSRDLLDLTLMINRIDLLTFGKRPAEVSSLMVSIGTRIQEIIEAQEQSHD